MIKYLINCSFGHGTTHGNWKIVENFSLIVELPINFNEDFRLPIYKKLQLLGFKFSVDDNNYYPQYIYKHTAQVLEIKPEIEQCVLISYPRNDNDYCTINNYLKRGWLIQNTVPIGDSNTVLITFYKNK